MILLVKILKKAKRLKNRNKLDKKGMILRRGLELDGWDASCSNLWECHPVGVRGQNIWVFLVPQIRG